MNQTGFGLTGSLQIYPSIEMKVNFFFHNESEKLKKKIRRTKERDEKKSERET